MRNIGLAALLCSLFNGYACCTSVGLMTYFMFAYSEIPLRNSLLFQKSPPKYEEVPHMLVEMKVI